ncbi:hypothetical protein NTGBS_780015 [Candidatus Nitrotoga sp. BS]|nr:hypothetical protein NTGBS_780015 [Candidatus Nitrotoga sp. BS]
MQRHQLLLGMQIMGTSLLFDRYTNSNLFFLFIQFFNG